MSKTKKLRNKFTALANQLTLDECREQLVLAYLQMEKCLQVLRGEDVEPIAMKDNGESSDLELFYMCKKVREELDYLNQEESKKQGDKITIGVDVDCSEAIRHLKEFKNEFERLRIDAKQRPRPDVYVMKVDLKEYFEPIHFDAIALAFHRMLIDNFLLIDQLSRDIL